MFGHLQLVADPCRYALQPLPVLQTSWVGALQILADTVEDLVENSPGKPWRHGFDGSLLVGSKETTLMVLDSRTGKLQGEVVVIGGQILEVSSELGAFSIYPDTNRFRRHFHALQAGFAKSYRHWQEWRYAKSCSDGNDGALRAA